MTNWPQNAYVGQKVVKIYDNGDIRPGYLKPPLNEVVTINYIGEGNSGRIMIDVEEYPSPADDEYFRGYWIGCFRPVQSTDTGMAILKELLINPHKVLEDA